jgi:hypothetical protein
MSSVPIVFPLLSIGVFMIFMASGNSHLSLTLILVVLLVGLNYQETQLSGRRERMETQAGIIKKKCDSEWMISALAPFKDPPMDSFRVNYIGLSTERTNQLRFIRDQVIGIAQGIVAHFPRKEIADKCAEKVAEDLGKDKWALVMNTWDTTFSVYIMCVLQNMWAPTLPSWIYSSLLQQYGTAPLMLCLLAIRAYFTTAGQFLNTKKVVPAPVDILVVNASNEIRMVMDYKRVFLGATPESLLQYSENASAEQINDLIRRLDKKEVITPEELRWILTAEYTVRFKNNLTSKWTLVLD